MEDVHSVMFFFFSSRRRHTRWNCDWSSDVCSSDLLLVRSRIPRCPVGGSGGLPLTDGCRTLRHWRSYSREILDRTRRRIRARRTRQDSRQGKRSEERRVGKEYRSEGYECQQRKK